MLSCLLYFPAQAGTAASAKRTIATKIDGRFTIGLLGIRDRDSHYKNLGDDCSRCCRSFSRFGLSCGMKDLSDDRAAEAEDGGEGIVANAEKVAKVIEPLLHYLARDDRPIFKDLLGLERVRMNSQKERCEDLVGRCRISQARLKGASHHRQIR